MSIQFQFDLRIPAGRQLVPLEAVMVLADRDEDQILALVDNGKMRWAFNIASPGAERREIRILRSSVLEYLDNRGAGAKGSDAQCLDDALAAILPRPQVVANVGTIRAVEVERRFCCSQGLVAKLVACQSIRLAGVGIGPKVSPYLLHESVSAFLRSRCLSIN